MPPADLGETSVLSLEGWGWGEEVVRAFNNYLEVL